MQVALTVSVRREAGAVRREAGALFLGNGVATGNPGHEQNTRESEPMMMFLIQFGSLCLAQGKG